MSDLNQNVDDIADDFPVIPAGIYDAVISLVDFAVDRDSGERKTDKNENEYLKGDFAITGGDFNGQHVFIPYMRPATQIFRDMCFAAGQRGVIENTDQLTGLPLRIKVKEEMYQDRMTSKVSGFL